jgi:hypothetical protein
MEEAKKTPVGGAGPTRKLPAGARGLQRNARARQVGPNSNRKVYSNSVLRNLPAAKQAEIIAHVDGPGCESYVETAAWLKKDGIPATDKMISNFRDWYLLWQKFRDTEEFALELTRMCRERGWIKTAAEERAAAQVFFNRFVLKEGDPKLWSMMERVNLLSDKVKLEEKRLELQLKKYRDKGDTGGNGEESGLSAEEREAAVKQILGIS